MSDTEEGAVVEQVAEQEPEDTPKEHEPPKDHPRFKEIYGKMKEFERQLAEKDETISSIAAHNQQLAESVGKVEDKVMQTERPDPYEDPDAYDAWMEARVLKKVKPEPEKQPNVPPLQNTQGVDPMVRNAYLADIQAGIHDDYHDIVNQVMPDIQADPVLRNQIMNSDNPPKEAYKYGQKKLKKAKATKDDTEDQGYVEGGTNPPTPSKKRKLNDQQKRTASALGISEADYLSQLDHIEKSRSA